MSTKSITYTPLLKNKALIDYVASHCLLTPSTTHGRGFYTVKKPLKVFKSVKKTASFSAPRCIVNLIIPVGSTIYVDETTYGYSNENTRKMRASCAKVHSIAGQYDKKQLREAVSGHDTSFVYRPGEVVIPTANFSFDPGACRSGIHFFVNLQDALDYQ